MKQDCGVIFAFEKKSWIRCQVKRESRVGLVPRRDVVRWRGPCVKDQCLQIAALVLKIVGSAAIAC
jgi:hypothetical protein